HGVAQPVDAAQNADVVAPVADGCPDLLEDRSPWARPRRGGTRASGRGVACRCCGHRRQFTRVHRPKYTTAMHVSVPTSTYASDGSRVGVGWYAPAMSLLAKAASGARLRPEEALALYDAPLFDVAAAADAVRRQRTDPAIVTYLIDRNINYSNVCSVGCSFCGFYRTRRQDDAYTLSDR